MARKQRHEEHENHERWLVSYADFITLLFAFFVVMYAISSVNEGKYKVLSNALVDAFQQPQTSAPKVQLDNQTIKGAPPKLMVIPAPSALPSNPKLDEQAQKMRGMAGDLRQSLGNLIDQGKVKVTQSKRGIAVEISDSILFDTGRADLQSSSQEALLAIASLVQNSDNLIQVEGHTDNQPIRAGQFPSNWELSAARAASVVRLFEQAGVAPQRMAAIGFGEFRPMDTNDQAQGRAKNRRVTLNILADNKDEVAILPNGQ
ncbi:MULTISPECIES: flagellar motor protein MotD [Deefgea]|uniref:Flagellar motor protein MotD n=1 Tax=Deefgea chitinilytica TaxID=570276 RepID=A0ABS2C728_9NEIS|nr:MULTISPECIES: flagellar motor protein MotD [Deefgea]MBM5569974.1 flagellar motor protein MotD [Deefgea chitinilytica]MBM9887203.1 flagellar motor protein MotD [Deefgea sp. CFH1-16]